LAASRAHSIGQNREGKSPPYRKWRKRGQGASGFGCYRRAAGDLTPSEAGELFKLVDGFARMLEARIFEERVAKLEHAVSLLAPRSPQGDRNSQDNAFCQPRQHEHVTEP
jgi:hypothetical protein